MPYSSDLNLTQTNALAMKISDNVLKGNVVANLLLTNKPKQFTGKDYTKTFTFKNYTTESGSSNFGTGLVQFNYAIPNTLGQLVFTPAFHFQELALNSREVTINNLDPRAAVKSKIRVMDEGSQTFSHKMGEFLYGTGGAVVAGRTNSLRAIIDDGDEAPAYGGNTRSAFAGGSLNSYAPAALGTLSASNDENVVTALSAARVGGQTPNLILTTDTIYNLYEALLSKTYNVDAGKVSRGQMTRLGFVDEGMRSGNSVEVAYSSIFIHTAAMVADQLCPAGYMFFINLGDMTWRSVPADGSQNEKAINLGQGTQFTSVYSDGSVKALNLKMRDWMVSEAQYGQTAVLMLDGNLTSDDPRKHAKLIFS